MKTLLYTMAPFNVLYCFVASLHFIQPREIANGLVPREDLNEPMIIVESV